MTGAMNSHVVAVRSGTSTGDIWIVVRDLDG